MQSLVGADVVDLWLLQASQEATSIDNGADSTKEFMI